MTPPKADPLAERIAARVAKLQHGPSYVGYESSHLRRATHYAAEARAYVRERLGRERVGQALYEAARARVGDSRAKKWEALDDYVREHYCIMADGAIALLEPEA
jgi:hypothetical protein